ncbi:MAG: hypothetical protein AYP45_12385 [Candidatus Brocadia carolinensis]|uniref:Uncharacterized protein n=1 Tax=Candidatus Brocadia carolinensis TaxID=1004156 RepID=A0A1V4ARZ1_9BACT|nr:MAG: hypothetical protein AYP45_12385 [Candidatus Brocadia caroliniensis]
MVSYLPLSAIQLPYVKARCHDKIKTFFLNRISDTQRLVGKRVATQYQVYKSQIVSLLSISPDSSDTREKQRKGVKGLYLWQNFSGKWQGNLVASAKLLRYVSIKVHFHSDIR